MSLSWKLFVAHARQQKVRLLLTALAMIAAIGVVLWVVSAYEAIASQFDEQTDDFIGNYTTFVVPKDADQQISPEVISAVASHPAVESANPVTQFKMMFRRANPLPDAGAPPRRFWPSVVGTDSPESRYPLMEGRWLDPNSQTESVVSSGVSDALGLKPGDAIRFRTVNGEVVDLDVVGIVQQPESEVEFAMTRTKGGAPGGVNRGPASLAAYVPMQLVPTLTGDTHPTNLIEVRMRPSKTADVLEDAIASANPAVELLRTDDIRSKISSGFEAEGARKQAYFVTALSILASAFIIFTTLSMGVNERARQMAVLRAVGLRRFQVAQLVFVEALVLAVFGWVGGLLGGWILLQLLANATPSLFPNGVQLGLASILLTGLCSFLGAILASILPIWKATRISPLEAMAPTPMRPKSGRWYVMATVVSLMLIAINPLLVYAVGMPEGVRFVLILLVGAPATVLGFALLAPLVVLGVERILSPLIAWIMRIQTGLVKSQLSTNMWRTTGIAASLMLGLGLYTATQVWGYSMLGGFMPGRWTPDTIVKFAEGIPREQYEQICQVTGIDSNRCLTAAVEQTKLVGDPLKAAERDSAVRQDNVSLVGLDTEKAFAGNNPLFQLRFVQGNREDALAKLQKGRFCLVPDTFDRLAGLKVGDTITMIPPNRPKEPVEYTIAGIVSMPGSNWITKTTGIRRHFVRTAGIVFAPEEEVREDFALPMLEYLWLDPQSGINDEQLKEALQAVVASAEKTSQRESAQQGIGPGRRVGGLSRDELQVTSLEDVRNSMRRRGGAAVGAMGWLPLITLLVVSLGIVNTMAASVRARRWEFGILRAIGLRRLGLVKLVLSEAIMIGLVASALSLLFGILTGWTCLGLVRYVSNQWFEGVSTPLVVPWSSLVFGYALTFTLCFLAALWPAISSGRTEPLTLLQAGRAST
ncbi:FtsX-like permease family protein [Bremerella sp. T1]|uniref:FtsX-like permease family protein n=1 Tax=Bremerella sp. TYQ1 TaxID=3119568 RepID=UPI001CCB5456|nr:ABC transporter permease [Bremerella volcania]UBM37058.1 ABC transporter permease [Bremerella volcania]